MNKLFLLILSIASVILSPVKCQITLNEQTFNNVISEDPWLVLFCSPNRLKICKEAMPIWEDISKELQGRVSVGFIDV